MHFLGRKIFKLRTALLALLPIVLLQLTIVTHHFDEHDVNYSEDLCHICLQLERIDSDSFDQTIHSVIPQLSELIRVEKSSFLVSILPFHNFESRAPPQV
tara:strand:+ start:39 stop:338 length:300 start_codon:yes stop_codon:yes gene_type:complete